MLVPSSSGLEFGAGRWIMGLERTALPTSCGRMIESYPQKVWK